MLSFSISLSISALIPSKSGRLYSMSLKPVKLDFAFALLNKIIGTTPHDVIIDNARISDMVTVMILRSFDDLVFFMNVPLTIYLNSALPLYYHTCKNVLNDKYARYYMIRFTSDILHTLFYHNVLYMSIFVILSLSKNRGDISYDVQIIKNILTS